MNTSDRAISFGRNCVSDVSARNGAECVLHPRVVGCPAGVRDRPELRDPLLLSQKPQGGLAPNLVMVNQVLDGSVDIADRCRASLGEDLARRLFRGRSHKGVPRAEVPEDGLDGDTGATRDVVKCDLVVEALDVEFQHRADDPAPGRRRGLRARPHPVGARLRRFRHIHVSRY